MQLKVLKEYADPIPGLLDVVAELNVRGIKVGSTTGYIRSMMDILAPEAGHGGYAPIASSAPTTCLPAGPTRGCATKTPCSWAFIPCRRW